MAENGQRWVSSDYRTTPDGTVTHKRWLNPDGSRKTGKDLEDELMRVELETIAQRLLSLARER
jgi:hypothetical protein